MRRELILAPTCFWIVSVLLLLTQICSAQTLIINEVSNGPSGNQEYVEFVVVDATIPFDCEANTPPCVDIRGWIFDDNSGYHGSGGIASGALRFSNAPLWGCVPVGTIILLYNDADPNINLPATDVSNSDGNCAIVAPISDPFLFEQNLTTPGAAACSYPATGWVPGGDWVLATLANNGDCARLVDLSGCEVFSVCWASCNDNTVIYFDSDGSGSQNVWYFNDGNPNMQSNWGEGSASGLTEETPGEPNNAANAAYIGQFNNNCIPVDPLEVTAVSTNADCGCSGTATATATGSLEGYSYEWTDEFYNDIGQNTANATGLCVGIYNVIATSGIGCSDTVSVNITSTGGGTINTTENVSVCVNSTVVYPDGSSEVVVAPTSQVSQLNSVGGCDSIITTNVLVVPFLASTDLQAVCLNTVITYPDGTTETITGNTTQTSDLVSSSGCDSVVTTIVTVIPNFSSTQNITVCPNSTFTYPDGTSELITASTTQVSNLTGVLVCDSIITTQVTLSQGFDEQVVTEVCLNSSYTYPDGNTEVITGPTAQVSTLTSIDGCDSTITTSIGLLQTPFTAETVEICAGDSYTFPDGTVRNNIQSSVTYTSSFPIPSGCDSIVETTLNLGSSPNFDFTYSPRPIGPFEFDTRFSVTDAQSNNFEWSIFDSDSLLLYSVTDSAFDYMFEEIAETYTVCVTSFSAAGCADTICQPVSTETNLTVYIPNAFTPEIEGESDRINDFFLPVVGGVTVDEYSFNIYNRWGEQVFTSDQQFTGWDGKFKGKLVQSDIYAYTLSFTVKGFTFLNRYKGHVTVLH